MHVFGEKGLIRIAKYLLDLVFLGGLLIFIGLPKILELYIDVLRMTGYENYWFLLGFLYITGFICLAMVREMKKIFKNLDKNNPFIIENVKSLNRIAAGSFLLAISYIVKIFCYNSFFTIIIAMIFIIFGLFMYVLAQVFYQAVMVKEENDLTI
ncbi:MAG: DUF2975 domain-containing protein [Deltaproteobacteria bacterium]